MEHRRFHRVSFNTDAELVHHELSYAVRLENISLRGALISSDECIMVPLGESCSLSLALDADNPPVLITAEVVHCFFSMVGVKFVEFGDGAERRIFEFMKRITSQPELLEREWTETLGHRLER